MSNEPSTPPRWEKIDTVYNQFDTLMEDAFTKEELNFLEIEIVFMMIKEKLFEEKLRAYNVYMDEENTHEPKPHPPKDFYR